MAIDESPEVHELLKHRIWWGAMVPLPACSSILAAVEVVGIIGNYAKSCFFPFPF